MSRLLVAVIVASVLWPSAALEAQAFRWLAFGDSITLGNYDELELGGYPARLSGLLGCSPGVCEVYNAGKSGEKTAGGVTRIDTVMNTQGPFDVLLLMEGTNDIFRELSFDTMVANLGLMAAKAEARGTEAVHASIIWFHPGGTHGTSKDDEVEALRNSMASLSATKSRYFVDIWDVLCPDSHPDVHGHGQDQCFNQHYPPAPEEDDRGHPNSSGYDMMADAFFDGITVVPAPGASDPQSPTGSVGDRQPLFVWDRESPADATWYRLVVEDTGDKVIDLWLKASTYCGPAQCLYRAASSFADGAYSWRVRGRNPAGAAPWSSDLAFTVFFDPIFEDGFESGDTSAWSSSQP